MSMQALSNSFGDRIITSGIWTARSRDLNPCDFFFLILTDKVYNGSPQTGELEEIVFWGERGNCKSCRTDLKGKSGPHPPVRGMSTCGMTQFSTSYVIYEL
jgi:hypothetical protein